MLEYILFLSTNSDHNDVQIKLMFQKLSVNKLIFEKSSDQIINLPTYIKSLKNRFRFDFEIVIKFRIVIQLGMVLRYLLYNVKIMFRFVCSPVNFFQFS